MKTKVGRTALCILLLGTILLALCDVSMAAEGAEEISMGVLVDLSGPLTTYGNDISNSLTIAAEDINNYFLIFLHLAILAIFRKTDLGT